MSNNSVWTVMQIEPDCAPLAWDVVFLDLGNAKDACCNETKAICDESEIDADPCIWWRDESNDKRFCYVGECDETLTTFVLTGAKVV